MLDLRSRGYCNKTSYKLIEMLEQHPNVQKLFLYRNNIDDEVLDVFVPALLNLSKLKWLDLGYNRINDRNIHKLVPLINNGLLNFLCLDRNTGLTIKSLPLITQWRESGIKVSTNLTLIAPNLVPKPTDEPVEDTPTTALSL